MASLQPAALDQLFRTARTYNQWTDTAVEEGVIRELYELLKWGPTSANSCPARFVWVRSPEGKATLSSLASETNRAKILAAPLTVIIGNDLDFAARLPQLNPARGAAMQPVFKQPGVAEVTAMRNGSLQGAYLIIAARALGLDCGPMSGFDAGKLNAEFFPDGKWKANLLCNLGYGDPTKLFPRNPRLEFAEASLVL